MESPVDTEIKELVHFAEPDELKQFLAAYAVRNLDFKQGLQNHFRFSEPRLCDHDYREQVVKCFDFDSPGRNMRGYNWRGLADEVAGALQALLEKARYLCRLKNYREASSIARVIIENIPRQYEEVDDSCGSLAEVFSESINLLTEILEENDAPEVVKEICDWLGKEVHQKVYYDYGFDEISSLLLPCALATGDIDKALEMAQERIQKSGKYEIEAAVLEKIELLHNFNLTEETERTIDKYIYLPRIRKIRLEDLLKEKKQHEAIELLQEGIVLAQNEGLAGLVADWKDELLNLYLELEDRKSILEYAEDLFYSGGDSMKYFHILKKEMNPDAWKPFLDKLLQILEGKDERNSYVLPHIYIEEGLWERLLALAKKSGFESLREYEKYLMPRFPKQITDLYVQKLTWYAENFTGREKYAFIASTIKRLRAFSAARNEMDKLLADLIVRYKSRKAMMDELSKIM